MTRLLVDHEFKKKEDMERSNGGVKGLEELNKITKGPQY
jgi:hypothetical protein